MDIVAMHKLFRLLGQEMGMEKVRSILPSSIDGYLQDAIQEQAVAIIRENVTTVYNDKIIVQDNFASPINGLSTLYREISINADGTYSSKFKIVANNLKDVMYFYGFSIKYDNADRYRNCRIIENNKVELTLDDYCNRATHKYPVITVSSSNEDSGSYSFDIYIGTPNILDSLKIKYIKMPRVVKFVSETSPDNVDCDLPQHLHKSIVELAVTKFFNSVGSTTNNVR